MPLPGPGAEVAVAGTLDVDNNGAVYRDNFGEQERKLVDFIDGYRSVGDYRFLGGDEIEMIGVERDLSFVRREYRHRHGKGERHREDKSKNSFHMFPPVN